jgi:predicted phosphoadenosine phosphosulfate sulfurtransferase
VGRKTAEAIVFILKRNVELYIKKQKRQGYSDGIPDEADSNLESLGKVPSYRRIVRAIFKNDIALSSLGFSRKKCHVYDSLKKEEIKRRK